MPPHSPPKPSPSKDEPMLSVSKTRKIKSLRPDHKNVEPATIVIEGEYTHNGHKKKRIKKQTIFDGECFPSDNDESLAYKKSVQSSVVFNPPDTAPEVIVKSEEIFKKSVAESRLSASEKIVRASVAASEK